MVWKPNENTQNRVLYALRLMQGKGWGIERAAKEAKTTRRSVRKYGQHLGVKFKGKEGTALQFVGQPIQKIEDFLIKMHGGMSASQAAKSLKTTVRTMSKQNYKGQPIIKKDNGRWISQFIVAEQVKMDYYAHIRNPQGNILGGNNVSGPDAAHPKNNNKRDPDYMEIWLNATAKIWTTLGSPGEAQMFHLKPITELIKKEMESLGIQDTNLMNDFSKNATVAQQMQQDSRVPPPYTVSALEQVTKRYGVTLEGWRAGIASDYKSRQVIDLIPKADFKGKKVNRKADVKVDVLYLGDMLSSYPATKKIAYKYSLADEN